jgi:hypothetical protein
VNQRDGGGRGMATRERRSVRLATHDYAATATYFITLVTVARLCLFGEVVDEKGAHRAKGPGAHRAPLLWGGSEA